MSYDEVRRRKTRRTGSTQGYMLRGRALSYRGRKRDAIEMGEAALDRVVDGRYEWRDAGLRRRVSLRTGVG